MGRRAREITAVSRIGPACIRRIKIDKGSFGNISEPCLVKQVHWGVVCGVFIPHENALLSPTIRRVSEIFKPQILHQHMTTPRCITLDFVNRQR